MAAAARVPPGSDPLSGTPRPSAEAVEALVRAIEAKEARGTSAPADAGAEPAVAEEPAAAADPGAEAPSRRTWSLPPLPVAIRPLGAATRGPIPGVMDRQHWEGVLAHEAQRQERYPRSVAVVVVELDGLDELVARMGPAAVNRLIPPCAGILVSVARASDRVARLATGRFGVILFETDEDGAARYAARAKAATHAWLATSPWDLRLEAGWTSTREPAELRRAVRTAEHDLRVRRG